MNNQKFPAQSIVGFRPGGRPENDYYPTPEYAVKALLEKEQFEGAIWEPACGLGDISRVLSDSGYQVISTDLVDMGFGRGGRDFLKETYLLAPNIITNPPYKLAGQFVQHAIDLRVEKAAFLLKLSFLEGVGRRGLFHYNPPAWIYVFSKRLQLTRNGEKYRNRGMIAFAWFVWVRGYHGSPMVGWI